MEEILHHLGALNYSNSWDFRHLRWCKISSINRIRSSLRKGNGFMNHRSGLAGSLSLQSNG